MAKSALRLTNIEASKSLFTNLATKNIYFSPMTQIACYSSKLSTSQIQKTNPDDMKKDSSMVEYVMNSNDSEEWYHRDYLCPKRFYESMLKRGNLYSFLSFLF